MTAELNPLSEAIGGLISEFLPHINSGVHLKKDEVSNVVLMLTTMHRIALSMEQENTAHRIGEQNRFARTMVDNLAGEKLVSLLGETGGKIIRPNFRKDS